MMMLCEDEVKYGARFVGRQAEQAILTECLYSDQSEFVAVYGRRRVGKTFLIRYVLEKHFSLFATGLPGGSYRDQINNMCMAIVQGFNVDYRPCNDWMEVMRYLADTITNDVSYKYRKKVIFFDEMPWMDTPKSDFLMAVEWFWNAYASARSDIFLIVCGSATTWITNNILRNVGGLYGRLTNQIYLEPFSLNECSQFYDLKHISMSREEQLKAYMIFGGVPYYLQFLRKDLSVAQNVDLLCFAKRGPLSMEYENLYRSMFKNFTSHIKVVEALATKSMGMTKKDICDMTGLPETGVTTVVLQELVDCGILNEYNQVGKKTKGKMYQLVDFFTLFYLRFVKDNKGVENFWTMNLNTPAVNSWEGYAFEQVCFSHLNQIKRALGIAGISTKVSSWKSADKENGAQIDMVIERSDKLINICEIKFASADYTITADYAKKLKNKLMAFKEETKTKSSLHLTMITTYGLKKNALHNSMVQSEVTSNCLFNF
ncbi:MAG: ATP-binding protein [Paludibacteraceae bacterium]|nr:ATP-binding protein [Paludibacteraceae bacterium]